MSTITLELIKELRDATGVSITECKKALEETGGNIDAAIDNLRAKGIAKAGKRADNATHEGRIAIKSEDGKTYVASLTCETDFVARTDNFTGFIEELMTALIAAGSVDAAKEAFTPRMSDIIQQTGENVVYGPMDIIEAPVVGSYVHSNSKVAAVVSANAGTDEEQIRQVAMHVTATNPTGLRVSEFPADAIAHERSVQMDMMKQDPKNEGKNESILSNIIEGKMKKFVEEGTLLTQPFVVNPEQTIEQYLGGDVLTAFKRYSI
jgi:elongation factor Ts